MARKSSYIIGGLAIAAVMIGALPAAQGIVAPTKVAPILEVNRTAKGNRLAVVDAGNRAGDFSRDERGPAARVGSCSFLRP